MKKVYILILNYMSYSDTISCIGNLKNQLKIQLKFLVVDNCSQNNSYNILLNEYKEDKFVEIIKNERNDGYASGNNLGIKYLEKKEYDYLIISNNDIEINNNLLIYKLINEYSNQKDIAFIAPMMYQNNKIVRSAWKQPTIFLSILNSLRIFSFYTQCIISYNFSKIINRVFKVDCLAGSFFMGDNNIFKKINYFDEGTFLFNEESILGYKVEKIKLNNYIVKNLKYDHLGSHTINSVYNVYSLSKIKLKSLLYYHRKYTKSNKLSILLLKILSLL